MKTHLLVAAALLTTTLALPAVDAGEGEVFCPPDEVVPYALCMASSVYNQTWYLYARLMSIIWRAVLDTCELITGSPCIFEDPGEATPLP